MDSSSVNFFFTLANCMTSIYLLAKTIDLFTKKEKTIDLVSRKKRKAIENEIVRDFRPSHFLLKIQSHSLLIDNHLDSYESGIFEAGGYKWTLVFYPLGKNQTSGSNHISLYLRIAESDTFPSGWEVDVCFKLFVQDQIFDKYFTIQDAREIKRFHAMKTEWGFSEFLSLDTFKDPSKGYLVNNSCVFGAEVFVVQFVDQCTRKSECFSMVRTPCGRGGTYTWDIENFAACKKSLYSEIFKIGGRSWKLQIFPEKNSLKTQFSLYLHLVDGENPPTNGRVFAKCKLRIQDQLYRRHQEKDVSGWFDSLHKSWGYAEFIFDASNGFIVKDKLVVEALFTIVSATTTVSRHAKQEQE